MLLRWPRWKHRHGDEGVGTTSNCLVTNVGYQLLDGSLSLVCSTVSRRATTKVSLTLPISGIVRHLSSPSTYALSQTNLNQVFTFIALVGSTPENCTLLSVSKRGSNETMYSERKTRNRTTALRSNHE